MRLVSIVLVAAIAIGWLIYDNRQDTDPPEADREASRADTAAEPPMLVPVETAPTDDDPILDSPEIEDAELPEEAPKRSPKPLPDPVGVGTCTLVLHVERDDKQVPLEGTVELWRLDAPGNEGWTRGDQRQAEQELTEGTATFEKLPAGRYRVYVHGQRRNTVDKPAFDVDGARTEVHLEVPAPIGRQVWVRLLDEQGEVIERALRIDTGTGHAKTWSAPRWVRHRKPTNGAGTIGIGGGGRYGFYSGQRHMTGDARGFDWGLVRDDTRRLHRSTKHKLIVDGRSVARLRVLGDVQRERTYVCVAIPMDYVYERVLLPNGTRAADHGAKIVVESKGVLQTEKTPLDVHLKLPFTVLVEAKGYETLRFKFSLEDDDWAHTLVPTKQD